MKLSGLIVCPLLLAALILLLSGICQVQLWVSDYRGIFLSVAAPSVQFRSINVDEVSWMQGWLETWPGWQDSWRVAWDCQDVDELRKIWSCALKEAAGISALRQVDLM